MAANSPLPIPLGDTTPGQIETPELNTSGPQQSDINAGLTPDQNIAIDEQIALENKYGESPLKAAALGAVDTGDFTGGITTFLTSPTVGKAMGQDGPLMSPEDLHQYALRNNKANLFGQVAGVAAPLVTGVGEVASGLSAIKAVGSLSEKTFAKMLLASGDLADDGRTTEKRVFGALVGVPDFVNAKQVGVKRNGHLRSPFVCDQNPI